MELEIVPDADVKLGNYKETLLVRYCVTKYVTVRPPSLEDELVIIVMAKLKEKRGLLGRKMSDGTIFS